MPWKPHTPCPPQQSIPKPVEQARAAADGAPGARNLGEGQRRHDLQDIRPELGVRLLGAPAVQPRPPRILRPIQRSDLPRRGGEHLFNPSWPLYAAILILSPTPMFQESCSTAVPLMYGAPSVGVAPLSYIMPPAQHEAGDNVHAEHS